MANKLQDKTKFLRPDVSFSHFPDSDSNNVVVLDLDGLEFFGKSKSHSYSIHFLYHLLRRPVAQFRLENSKSFGWYAYLLAFEFFDCWNLQLFFVSERLIVEVAASEYQQKGAHVDE